MDVFDLDTFRAAPLARAPFEHLVLQNFIKPPALARINGDYPAIEESGSFPLKHLTFGPGFQELVDALEADEFRTAFAEKFGVDLADRPTTITVRGRCAANNGGIHTDSASKIITVLLYTNSTWDHPGGRLRLLRSGRDIDDVAVEAPPTAGTLVAFLRSNHSWHGHLPFVGERRVIQFNWVTTVGNQRIAILRHTASASFKRMTKMFRRAA